MANSTEKAIGIVLLVIIVFMAFFGLVPFLMRGFGVMIPHMIKLPNIVHVEYGIPGIIRGLTFGILPLALLILWVLVIVWVYRDAERRGMSGVLWALLVFIGNIIGLLIYLIVRNDTTRANASLEATVACINCGKLVAQKYVFCPHCGTKLKSTCPSCDEAVASDWSICPYCGEKLAKK